MYPGRCAWISVFALMSRLPACAQAPTDSPPPIQAPAPQDRESAQANAPERLSDVAEITAEEAHIEDDGRRIRARGVVVKLGEYTLSGANLDGDLEGDLVFSGNPVLTYRDQRVVGDLIRFNVKTKAYKIERASAALSPSFLKGKATSPLYVTGGFVEGTRGGPITVAGGDLTTCDKPHRDYYLKTGSITVVPGKHIILRRVGFVLWGKRIITLPTVTIPLDRRVRHSGYTPQVGQSQDEGFFVKAAFNYLAANRAPGVYRVDLMQKKGIGLGISQGWNDARSAGEISLYAIPIGGTGSNASGRLNLRQLLGGGQTITLQNDFQQNSYLSLPQTTSNSSRFGFQRQVPGAGTTFSLSRQDSKSQGFGSLSYSSNLAQTFSIGQTGSVSFGGDYSRYETSGAGANQRNEQLATRFEADQRAQNYMLRLSANKNIPIGQRTAGSFFGGVEKLPEITLSSFRFTQGALSRLPATFNVSAGKYSEGTTLAGQNARIDTERVIAGVDITGARTSLTPSTTLNTSGTFTQSFYGEGAAMYVLRNNTTLTQRWNKRSGLNLNYSYQRAEGGTPFRFDVMGQYHALNADMGMLDDQKMQLTARVGYDFARTGFAGFRQPWQTLSANLLLRPVTWVRFQNLFSFDPNNGKVTTVTSDLRLRGRNEFAFDLVTRYDPKRAKIGNANAYLNLPLGSVWRAVLLMQYNGYLNRFESKNLQITRDFHCLEASITYMENPFGFRADRQIFFQLRIKAFPAFQRFGSGGFGQALDTGVGGIY